MRITYIDGLRGFTMFLVVFWHILALGFGVEESVLGSFFRTFRMPTFFFISGFIGYKVLTKFAASTTISLLKKKTFVQLVPTAIVFSFYKLCMGDSPLSFFERGLVGYWFTLVLFEMFLFFYITSFLVNKKGGSVLQNCIYVLVVLFSGILGLYFHHLQDRAPQVVRILSIGNFFVYLPFFCTGLMVKKYKEDLLPIITNKYSFATLFSIFAIGFLLIINVLSKESHPILFYFFSEYLLRFSGLFLIFDIFYHSASFFDSETKLSRVMRFIGGRTLDIYLLHYFFIPDLSNYGHFFFQGGKEFIIGEIFVVSVLATLIIFICLLISLCLRKSDILAKYLFGILPKEK